MGIFSGITVLDFACGVSGNLSTMILADLGASVIHIDQIGEDIFQGDRYHDITLQELSMMRGKKRIALDLSNSEQRSILLKLAAKADVFLEDRNPGETAAFGVSYDDLTKVNPQICYTSISAFGQTGPKKDLPSSELIMEAFCGLMDVTGEVGGIPMRTGIPIADIYSALYGVIGTIGMLIHKLESGEGQYLDVAKADCMLTILENGVVNYLAVGNVQKRIGNQHSVNVPFREFHTKDDQDILITVNRDNTFAALCKILGCEELVADPRYCSGEMRRLHREECTQEVIDRVKNWNVEEIEKELDAAGIPCATINSVDLIVNSDNTAARNMLIKGSYPGLEEYTVPNSPFKFTATPVEVNGAVSSFGMDTQDILKEFGLV